jgi:DNA-binding transcriptional ArsR family regulator
MSGEWMATVAAESGEWLTETTCVQANIWLFCQIAKYMTTAQKTVLSKRAAVIKALAHPSRLLIAEALMEGEMCVCDLKELVGADMSTVSKHLSVMRQAGVLVSDKRGLNIYYRLACDCLGDFLRCLDQLAPKKAKTKSCC